MAAAISQLPSSDLSHFSRKQHLAQTFEAYRAELDDENALRESLIILSRSITQLSKKLIFHLHRGATLPTPAQRQKNLEQGKGKEREIALLFEQIRDKLRKANKRSGMRKGGKGEEEREVREEEEEDGWEWGFWKWRKSVTPGLEEYIEGLSFMWYLEHGSLVSLEDVQKAVSDENGQPYLVVTPEDYILGMSDLTGELMRYATNALGTGDHETPLAVCDFVRTVKTHFDAINPDSLRQLSKKQDETQRSLEKIEKVCYALRLRLIEFADRPDILAQMAKRALDDVADKGGSGPAAE
ncbi:hypothetical protein L202_03161 [Cryptococcus amylolentus CBS 6039]|uniref:Translin n=1 Tax=Cryptococcus amylolentus CBS 6039 TaxID=1295533 RepID=A0A1E3HZA0_9TREE|nr:hypothetical protein L202_03161 [Cryptococcus amylolentus CBS 6039]ODN81066.1 hypothetical protein L202_03161 [Cryptococcus amylolentus CBS 6039]